MLTQMEKDDKIKTDENECKRSSSTQNNGEYHDKRTDKMGAVS